MCPRPDGSVDMAVKAAAGRGAGWRPVGILLLAVAVALVATLTAAWSSHNASATAGDGSKIVAIGAESEYADVISQVGGQYVAVNALMSNPNTDPHSFEASIGVAREVGRAQLVVQNGLGYDSFMDSVESATPNSSRTVLNVQRLLHLPDSTPNPHLWYDPERMPQVADAIAASLSSIQPSHAAYFTARAAAFKSGLASLTTAIASFKSAYA